MNKLDALKQEWKKQRFDLQLSKEELYELTQKKSISSIKWVFIFSCVEFFAYLFFPLLIPDYFEAFEYYRSIHLYEFSIVISILGYAILSYFMIQFYLNYIKIKTSDSISILIETIIKSRKSVNKYIIYNLGVFIVFLNVVLINAFRYDENYIHLMNQDVAGEGSIIKMVVAIIIIMILVMAVLTGFYYLVYGRYFFKLKRHVQELKQIED